MDPTNKFILLNLSALGTETRISGSSVHVTGEDADLTIATTGITTAFGYASGTVKTITVEGHPISLDSSIGYMIGSYQAVLETLPGTDARIRTMFSDNLDRNQEIAFSQAVNAENSVIYGVAGVMAVQTTNMTSVRAATIRMSAPITWINEHGGTSSIRILRIGDDGKAEVLATAFSGYGEESTMIFEGSSPGLSTFGLAAIVPAEPGRIPVILSAPQIVETEAPIAGAVTAAEGTGKAPLPWGLAMTAMSGVLLISTVIIGINLVRFGRVLPPKH
jgi:hypothetical protein